MMMNRTKKQPQGLLIDEVLPGSCADEAELSPGDLLLAVNGEPLRDLIDFHYHGSEPELLLEVQKPDGELWEVYLERDEGEPLGLVFAPPEPTRCGNRCVFCFVHQLPKGLRAPLYVKDEDYRLSFLYGNYVTLTNLSPGDLERICAQRLSPLYVSVHATEPGLRERLLGNRGIPPILDLLRQLTAARIAIHTQVVLCPGWNDGEALERTVADLAALHPGVASLAVVPVGLTAHRRGLPKLAPVTADYAANVLDVWLPRAEQLRRELGEPFLFFADEFFLAAGHPFPPLAEYGDLPQLENGVGLVPLFREEATAVIRRARRQRCRQVTVITGVSAAPELDSFLQQLGRKTGGTYTTVAVANRLFGPSVTVAGLVAGRDILATLQGRELGDLVVVPDVMLKEGAGVFLDDLSIDELAAALGCPVTVAQSSPAGLYAALRAV